MFCVVLACAAIRYEAFAEIRNKIAAVRNSDLPRDVLGGGILLPEHPAIRQ